MNKTSAVITVTLLASENMEMVSNRLNWLTLNNKIIANLILKLLGLKVEVVEVNTEYEDLSDIT